MNDGIGALWCPVLLLGLIVFQLPASRAAEVYRCENAGRVTYTDTPCDARAQPIVIAEPQTIESGAGSDLAKVYDERRAREHRERTQADQLWLEQHDAAKADELQVRNALVEGRVVAGMTQQQVRQVWGEPSDVQLQIDQNASRERWVYREARGGSQGRRTVSFENGRVAGASGSNSKSGGSHPKKSRGHADDEKKQDR